MEPDPVQILVRAGQMEADVVVIDQGEAEDLPGLGSHLLYEYPELLVITLSGHDGASAYRLEVVRRELEKPLGSSLLAAIRGQQREGSPPAEESYP